MPQKIKKYFFTIGNFLISFVLLLTFALSKYQDFQSYRLELLQKRIELKNEQDYWASLDKLEGELKNYDPELTKIDAGLPSIPLAPATLNLLQKTASQRSMILKKIDFGKVSLVSERPYLLKREIALIVESSYDSFRQFLSEIEQSSRLIQVESLNFSLPEAGKGDIFTFNLVISINYLPEEKPVTSEASQKSTFEEF